MSYQHPTVLVVDDDENFLANLAIDIGNQGYTVAVAPDGAAALAIMRHAKPCIVVLDLHMPKMTGQEFREAQLADPELKDVPVIVCSSGGELQYISDRLGAAGFLEKPIKLPELMALLRRYCLK